MRSASRTATAHRVVLAAWALCQIVSGQAAAPASHAQFTRHLVDAAIERTSQHVRYVSEYVRIPYPGGDVPADIGVCTDEIIRSYRAVGVDLQKEVHDDMVKNFAAYPNQRRWLLAHPDSNIDHRRVPNLMGVLSAQGGSVADFQPRGRLRTRRSRDLGSGAECAAHWNCGRSESAREWAVHGRTQHWRGAEDGGRAVRLEDHGAL
jgi:uncharacterized protein YijF (DUF1287 family)